MTPEEGIEKIKYRLDLCEFNAPKEMMEDSTVWTRAFIELASGRSKQGYYSLGALYQLRWCEDEAMVLDFFVNNLDEKSKNQVLAFYTNYIHELTHHNDMMITPFGVNYHVKLCREYLNFQNFGTELLKNPYLVKPWTRIIDYESNVFASLKKIDNEKFYETWNILMGQIYYFDALFNISNWGKRNATKGWNNNTKPVKVFNQEFEKVTVRGFFLTIRISDDNDYLTPIAILECRALINCIQWIYWTMGDTLACKNAILVYLTNIYQQTIPEYTFIVNLFTQYYGCHNIQDFVKTRSLSELKGMLLMINACCWYALQAPPVMNENSLHNSNPIARLLLSIRAMREIVVTKKTFTHVPEFLDSLDRSQDASHFQPILSILEYCLRYLEHYKMVNSGGNNNEQIKQHFERIIDTQISQIYKRYRSEYPYASLIGLAETGNPMLGIEDNEMDSLLLDYVPSEETKDWFNDRHTLLFKLQDQAETVRMLKKWFTI